MDVATKIAPFTFENMFESLTKLTDKKGAGTRENSSLVGNLVFPLTSYESVI
jgi:hypothetical protein